MNLTRTQIGWIVGLASLALFGGWRLFWFLTDDAFIHFRYVGNSILGYGYVWNPPPFRPVEGYTSFLWVALLDVVWRVTGTLPTRSANALALLFSWFSLLLTTWVVLRMRLGAALESRRGWLLVLVLAGLVTHRTFLTWTSSGLETAMFDFWVVAWLVAGLSLARRRSTRGCFALSALASLVYLTRPEGLLFGAATLAMLAAIGFESRAQPGAWVRSAAAATPLLAIPAHLAWRLQTYGEWLPNTYYAKHVAAWPESGVRYLLSYTLEHALWFWALPFAVFAPRLLRARWRTWREAAGAGPVTGWIRTGGVADMAVAAFLANVLYYTLVIGGDSFEYRIYAQLVPVTLISFAWVIDRSGLGPRAALASLAAFVALAAPIAWTHWYQATKVPPDLAADEDFSVPIADRLPGFLRWYGRHFDELQAWLVPNLVCGRHHNHVHFTAQLLETYPERDLEARMPTDDIPVLVADAVGVVGWSLPHVAIIDEHGLNDYVVARTAVPLERGRRMAHDRLAPDAYLREFRENVVIREAGRVRIRKRKKPPLGAADVEEIERRWWELAAQGSVE